jgi:alpha-L-fucosidase
MKRIALILASGLFASVALLPGADSGPAPVSERRVTELQQLRFGMFVCWSFSTFSGKEWTPGVTNISLFAAKDCDTDQWAKTAKEAGMGYILFLTKHHDGFCLWDTRTTERKVTKASLGRDVLAELRKSCDKYGIKLALYFSEGEWAWPDFPDGRQRQANGGYNPEMKKAQLKELLTQYGPVEYIWFDHAVGDGGLGHEETVAFCKALQPDCFIGFNHGPPAGDIRLGEMGHPGPLADESAAGFNAGHMKGYTGYRLAEFTYPILPEHQGGAMWFYSLPQHDSLCLPAEKIYNDYLGAVKYGNVFALDVGPDCNGRIREIDVQTLRKVGQMIKNPPEGSSAAPPKEAWKIDLLKQPIRAFCIDFNWQIRGDNLWFAEPGHWADADPAAHARWYKDVGANCIQTFVLSCNGYAWYKGGPIPEQPGLKSNFLTDVVRLGHEQHLLVMGYYCVGANSLWGQRHPDQSYGTPSAMHIPLTKEYVAYLCASVEDALKRTGIDGFMLDWLANTSGKWLDCEKAMYVELMGGPFPGADKISATEKATFDRRAVERCWIRIRDAARKVKPDCILWPNGLQHMDLAGVDWLLNESPDVHATEAAAQQLGYRSVRLIQNQVGWAEHDARKVFSRVKYRARDFYGFAAPYDNSLPLPVTEYLQRPIDDFKGTNRMTINDRNIAALARFYLGKPVEPPPGVGLATDKPAKASSVWGSGYGADKAFDDDESTRWGAAPESRSGWLEVDLGKDTQVSRAVVKELSFPRTQEFAIEHKEGEIWKPLAIGTTIVGTRTFDFPKVTARYFRLNIIKASEVPTIEEFQLFE